MRLTDIEINTLLEEVVRQHKKSISGKDYVPEYNPVYRDCIEMREKIRVHADMHTFPLSLFKKKAPNEDEAQFDYRKQNYKPVTMPFWNRALQVLNRVWNVQNYTIQWPAEEEEEKQQDYFLKQYPKYQSLISFFESVVTRWKVNDPNAVLCIRPRYIPTIIDENTGEAKVIDTERIEPEAVIFDSARVLRFEDDRYCMIELPDKSPVRHGNTTVMEGLIYELYDEEYIWRIIQVGKKSDYEFDISIYYPHRLGYMPCYKLRGIPMEQDGRLVYKSHFFDAVPLLDTALYDNSTLDISKVGAAFPHRWAISEACTHSGCNNGYVLEGEGMDVKQVACPSCKGTGKKTMFNPMGVFEVRPPSAVDDPIPTPPFGFVEPQLGTLEFLDKQIEKNIIKAFAMLNIEVTASIAKGDETATGKLIDREELFSFLLTFASELFNLLESTIRSVGEMRYGAAFNMPEVVAPTNFEIRGERELTEEFQKAKEAGLPDLILKQLSLELIQTRFSNSEQLIKLMLLIQATDSLATMEPTEVAASKGAGLVENWEVLLHIRIHSYIGDAIAADANWMDKPLKEQKEELIARAKEESEAIDKAKEFDAEKLIGRMGIGNNQA